MRTTAQNVRDWRRTGTVVPRLSIWEQVEQTSFMNVVDLVRLLDLNEFGNTG